MRRARADGRDNDRDVTSEPPSGESEGTMCARPLNEEYSAPSYLAHSQATSRTPSVPVHTDDQGRIARQPANLDASGLRSSARRRWLPASLRKRFVVPSPAAEASAAARSGGRVWSGGWSTECSATPRCPWTSASCSQGCPTAPAHIFNSVRSNSHAAARSPARAYVCASSVRMARR